jgi:hypothetical protein
MLFRISLDRGGVVLGRLAISSSCLSALGLYRYFNLLTSFLIIPLVVLAIEMQYVGKVRMWMRMIMRVEGREMRK